MEIKLYNLPKISLNKWYSSQHWSFRKKAKDNYKLLIKSQFKQVLSKEFSYEVGYEFNFKTKPLDASNCVAMVKLIEDVIFEDDKYDIITSLNVKSKKSKEEFIKIIIKKF